MNTTARRELRAWTRAAGLTLLIIVTAVVLVAVGVASI